MTVAVDLEAPPRSRSETLRQTILRAAEYLPNQGPVAAFVFDNPLRAFENLKFDEAVKRAAALYGCQPYLTVDRFRQAYERGRITDEDLNAVLSEDLDAGADESILGLCTRRELRMAMLKFPLREAPDDELRWFMAECEVLTRFLPEAPQHVWETRLEQTRQWVMQDVLPNKSSGLGREGEAPAEPRITARQEPRPPESPRPPELSKYSVLAEVFESLGESRIESWSTAKWQQFCLQSLWRLCRVGSSTVPQTATRTPALRHRDDLLRATTIDSDQLVNEILIRFCAAYLDQGLAEWILPHRDAGFFAAFVQMHRQPIGPPIPWRRGLAAELERIHAAKLEPLDSILESLAALGVREEQSSDFVIASLLALRGWGALLWQNDVRSDRVPIAAKAGSLIEFLAVRLILDRLALAHVAREQLKFAGPLSELRQTLRKRDDERNSGHIDGRAFVLFQLGQFLGWAPAALSRLSTDEWFKLISEVETFDELERRRVLHLGFERNYRVRALDAIAVHTQPRGVGFQPAEQQQGSLIADLRSQTSDGVGRALLPVCESDGQECPSYDEPTEVSDVEFQAVFCIDAREESFRRHLEETNPRVETFGCPGFFCVPIYFRGVGDAHYSTLCPIVVRPQHWVIEEPVYSMAHFDQTRANARKAIGTATHKVHRGSRSFVRGAMLTAGLGVLATVPLVARVLFPRFAARIRRGAESLVKPFPATRLRLERLDAKPSNSDDGIGFSVEEMANFGERVLRDLGLIKGFAQFVMFFGHGSVCQNNPHKSCYDCGACTGAAGGPNARALAAMLNDRRIRDILATRGIPIPVETIFIGGLHNTGNDTISFFDLDLIPRSQRPAFEAAKATLDQACERNAHERCRRFYSAPLDLTPAEALLHVEDRTEDLAQVRPEFGNSTNALCFVGRRSRVRGLFMDRRCFMHSYDASGDDLEATILGRILGPVVFVCAGINLQYLFSYIDSPGWGSGTKLPHNITSLLGVMDGASSDIRTGLPWQGVEIHEPVRLLFVIECTPEAIVKIMDRNAVVGRLIRNEWVQLVLLDRDSNRMQVFNDDRFEPYTPTSTELPTRPTSADWYRGWREHLGFAAIRAESQLGTQPGTEPATQ